MNLAIARYFGIALPFMVAACSATAPPDYSPGYSYVASSGGSDVLAPDACLAEPADIPPARRSPSDSLTPELGPHLPPGCANAYNLQLMAERKSDLVKGRKMGPASGAVTARAARRYIYGEEQPQGGANESSTPEASTQTVPPS